MTGRIMTLTVFFLLLLIIAWKDAAEQIIPDRLTAALLITGIVAVFTMPEVTLASRTLGLLVGGLPLFGIALLRPGAFGGGDVKLMAAGGFFLGTGRTAAALIAGFLMGGIYGALLLFLGKKDRKGHFAFGPFLCAGMAFGFWFGDAFWRW